MSKKKKVAVARIFADLIKADRIIDTGEMECWSNVCSRYDIDSAVRTEARNISFADAVNDICDSDLKGDLLGDCRAMTISDGFCAHSEALLMIALMSMLGDNRALDAEILSIPRTNLNIDIGTVLYIESSFHPEINETIQARYRTIYKELQLAGFHFIYIPRVIDHYRHTDEKLFKDILSFLAPYFSETRIESAYQELMDMKTSEFCNDLLCNKCGITDLRNTHPALLIKIGNSFVGQNQYANYLKLHVRGDIVLLVREFVDAFTAMLSSDIVVVNTSEERDNQFHFHGFYKQLLDIFLVPRDKQSRIVINPERESIEFPEISGDCTGLNRRERALYALFLCYGSKGIDFSKPRTAAAFDKYKSRMEEIQRRYRTVYAKFGGNPENAPDITDYSIRGPIVANVRRWIKSMQGLHNPNDYNIIKNPDKSIAIHINPQLVFVDTYGSLKEIPLAKSSFYASWKNPESV